MESDRRGPGFSGLYPASGGWVRSARSSSCCQLTRRAPAHLALCWVPMTGDGTGLAGMATMEA